MKGAWGVACLSNPFGNTYADAPEVFWFPPERSNWCWSVGTPSSLLMILRDCDLPQFFSIEYIKPMLLSPINNNNKIEWLMKQRITITPLSPSSIIADKRMRILLMYIPHASSEGLRSRDRQKDVANLKLFAFERKYNVASRNLQEKINVASYLLQSKPSL